MAHTGCTVSLNGTVEDLQQRFWYENLCLGNLLSGCCCVAVVDGDGGVEDDESCSVNLNAGLCDALQLDFVLGELSAEGLLGGVVDAGNKVVESFLSLFTY